MHINLPFADDAEFGRLHAAVRLLLPLLPGLAASSPLVEGRRTGTMDNRLDYYRGNCARIPAVTGLVIPEPVFSVHDYHDRILAPIYAALAAHGAGEVLQHEWVNARGAIARFDRMAIEIRLLDVQECPRADLAIAELVVAVVRALTEERWCSEQQQRSWDTGSLAALLMAHIEDADRAGIGDSKLLRCFGYRKSSEARSGQLWAWLAEQMAGEGTLSANAEQVLEHVLSKGCLARRIDTAVAGSGRSGIFEVYQELRDCLAQGRLY
jgi:carboxylate-amine ligase